MINESSAVSQVLHNKVFVTTFMGWFIAQTIKVVVGVIAEKKFNFKWFVGTGGMPSSHASGVTALAASVGLGVGTGSPLFAVACMFAVVVIMDAQGVRRAAGKQAEVLNKILDDAYEHKPISEDRLKELLGHTPFQVIVGVLLGLLIAFTSYGIV